MMTNDTPRTDALFTGDMDAETYSHMVTLARSLERENARLRAALERIERLTGSTGGYKALIEDNRTTARLALAGGAP